MATTNYKFPEVESTDRIAASAINDLATAVDSALKKVDDKASGGDTYTLPPATSTTLGGVKVGSGVNVAGDGTISVTPYTLPDATTTSKGGIIVGTGLTVSGGTVSVSATWLEGQIASAVQAYLTEHYGTGFTWGDIETNGFTHPTEG